LLDFELYGYAYLSNHGSILAGVRSAEHMSAIMEYLHSNISRELGRKENHDWPGRFWERRGRAIVILGDEDLEERMRYLLSNSTKENLVSRPERWPGAHCARPLCHGTKELGLWVNRTLYGKLQRKQGPNTNIPGSQYEIYYEVKLSKLPCWKDLTDDEYQKRIRAMCFEISTEAAEERKRTGKRVLGTKKLLAFSPHHRPVLMERSPAPAVHCCDKHLREKFVLAYRSFVVAYRKANEALRRGIEGFSFPEGGIPPTCRFVPETG